MRITEIIKNYTSKKGKLPVYTTGPDGQLKDGRHISEIEDKDFIHVEIVNTDSTYETR